jgi:RES domain-containing protein
MTKVYRICKTKYSLIAFDGEGAFRAGGRWNSIGTRVVYTAESLSLAVLEMLVHFQDQSVLSTYSFIEVKIDESLILSVFEIAKLPKRWNQYPSSYEIQTIGDEWAKNNLSAVLKVPSAIIQSESNYLINPKHKDFTQISTGIPRDFIFDERLLKATK